MPVLFGGGVSWLIGQTVIFPAVIGASLSLKIHAKKKIHTPDAKTNFSTRKILRKLLRQVRSISFATHLGSLEHCKEIT